MLKLLNPHFFNKVADIILRPTVILMMLITPYSLYQALVASPIDYQQKDMVRVMYIHVPAAWMSLAVYSFIAICSFSNLVWKTKMSYIIAAAAAPVGMSFALITLVTGSLWGKPIWGTWWVWDARLTSMLILFLFYLTYVAIINCGDNIIRAEKPASVLAVIGFINIPIVKFSVDIWSSLHQSSSVIRLGGPTIHGSMLQPLILMFCSFVLYFIVILIVRTRIILKSFFL